MGYREAGRACNVFLSSLRTYVYIHLAYTGNRMGTREERPPTMVIPAPSGGVNVVKVTINYEAVK